MYSVRTSRTCLWPKDLRLLRRRCISSHQACTILGLEHSATNLTFHQLRQAYLQAAKQCHPDVSSHAAQSHRDFLSVTQAYERLQAEIRGTAGAASDDLTDTIFSDSSETDFRLACEQQLGIPAEIVEECKQNPIFRQWLHGNNSHWAQIWRTFLAGHGGFSPQLKPPAGSLEGGSTLSSRIRARRKRK